MDQNSDIPHLKKTKQNKTNNKQHKTLNQQTYNSFISF